MLDDYNKKKLLIGLTIALAGTITSFGLINSITIPLWWFVTNTHSGGTDTGSIPIMNMYIGFTMAFLIVAMVGYSIVFSSKN